MAGGQVPERLQNAPVNWSWQLVLLGINGAVGGFLFGYDTCSMSASLLQLKDSSEIVQCPGLTPTGLNLAEQQMVTSFVVLGAFGGAIFAGPSAFHYGRRKTLLSGSGIFFVGALMMAASTDLAFMLVARIVTGVGVGISSHTVPLYISECAPPQLRGSFCFMNDLMIVFGQFIAAIISTIFFQFEVVYGWRWILGLGAVPAIMMFIGFSLQPESPRWLVSQTRMEEAKEVLQTLRGEDADSEVIQHEFNEMVEGIKTEQWTADHETTVYETYIKDSRVRNALLLGCGLQFLQQWSGINTIMYYGASVLEFASPDPDGPPNCFNPQNKNNVAWTILFAFGQLPGVFSSWYLVDKLGRRPLILVSTMGAFVSLVVCGFVFYAEEVSKPAVIVFVMLYLMSFGAGMSPVPWTVNAEIHPLPVRAQCISCSCSTNWINNYIVSATFLSLAEALSTHRSDREGHPDGVFWLYAAFTGVGMLVLYRHMPETKGLTLEEMGQLFEDADDADKVSSETSPLLSRGSKI
mmetsp:Transcript_120141/g.218349  ORF Transcript_120141/g.218349 Transcript_120141/m.218349 type:complete len:521 (-) Transcript_120141:73-1635(-)